MISITLAYELKKAGLEWQPALHDFFSLPDRLMDDKVFVISDLLVNIEQLQGTQIVSFQGAPEWALDYLVTSDVIWIPTETQLRQRLESALLASGSLDLVLTTTIAGVRLDFSYRDQKLSFEARDALDVYARALLYLLSYDQGEG
jgi:hypothetical protein